jgi:hypothetical protein
MSERACAGTHMEPEHLIFVISKFRSVERCNTMNIFQNIFKKISLAVGFFNNMNIQISVVGNVYSVRATIKYRSKDFNRLVDFKLEIKMRRTLSN